MPFNNPGPIVEYYAFMNTSDLVRWLYGNCARGSRLIYGTNSFLIGLSVFLLGFKQIYLAVMISKILHSKELISNKVERMALGLQCLFFAIYALYFSIYIILTITTQDGGQIFRNMQVFNITNCFLTFATTIMFFSSLYKINQVM